jgi:hypothetical protein
MLRHVLFFGVFVPTLFIRGGLYAQKPAEQKISFSCARILPGEALYQLSRETGIPVAFSNRIFDGCPPVSISVSGIILSEVLEKITACAPVSWKTVGEQIVFFRDERFYTLSGYVSDSETGERLIGASVRVLNSVKPGAFSNEFGFFSLTLPEGSYRLRVSYVGCEDQFLPVQLQRNTQLHLKLVASETLPEITVSATNPAAGHEQNSVFFSEIDLNALLEMPSPGGEPDLFRFAALDPGIVSGVDGLGGLNIRGGNADQNLILLDDVPVYSPGHALGLFSIFNPAMLKSVRLWKGDPPATFGGRAASAIDIRTRDGDLEHTHASLSAGLFAGTATVETPVERGKSTLLVSGRSTYFSPWLRLYERKSTARVLPDTGLAYRFSDLNVKLSRIFSEKDRVYLSVYRGGDRFEQDFKTYYRSPEPDFPDLIQTSILENRWGNFTASLRWNRVLSPRWFMNNTLIVSDFGQSYRRVNALQAIASSGEPEGPALTYTGVFQSRIRDFGLKTDVSFFLSERLIVRAGAGLTRHRFMPGVQSLTFTIQFDAGTLDSLAALRLNDNLLQSVEPHAYTAGEWSPGRGWTLHGGLYLGASLGKPGNFYALQPRFFLEKKWGNAISMFGSVSRMTQFLHQIGTQNIGFQSEIWVPASETAPPEHSALLSAGLSGQVFGCKWSLAFFQRHLENLVSFSRTDNISTFTDGANVAGWESALDKGKGRSRGLELEIRKKWRGTHMVLAYTLSRTTRQFRQINGGQEFPFRYDRPHDLKISVGQRLSKWLEANVLWVWGSGMPVTLNNVKFLDFDGTYVYEPDLPFSLVFSDVVAFSSVNNFRLPDYYHLDATLNAFFQLGETRHTAQIGVYNALDRTNPFAVYVYRDAPGDPRSRVLQYSLMPLMPVFRYEVRF